MKRILSVLVVVSIFMATFISCDFDHEHIFSNDWEKDADYHWHACTVDGCKEKLDNELHNFEVVTDESGAFINRCTVCGETNDKVSTPTEHEHLFVEEYLYNENFHWYACLFDGCYEITDKSEHVYDNPEVTYEDAKITIKRTCVDCGYESIEIQDVKTEVDDAISWNEAFKNFKLTNFSMNVHLTSEGLTLTNHCVVTENSAYYCIPDIKEFYTVPNGDEFVTYLKEFWGEKPFTKLKDTSNTYLVGAQTETVIQVSFEDNFDKFTYDPETASYVCSDVIEAIAYNFDGSVWETLYCYDCVIKIVDGDIVYIATSYYYGDFLPDENNHASLEYYNIGISVVTIPDSVIDTAIDENNIIDPDTLSQ